MYLGIAPVDSDGPSWWERILGGITGALGPAPTYPTPTYPYPPGYPYPPAPYPNIQQDTGTNWMPIITAGVVVLVGVVLLSKR